jgi:hypothetical protein
VSGETQAGNVVVIDLSTEDPDSSLLAAIVEQPKCGSGIIDQENGRLIYTAKSTSTISSPACPGDENNGWQDTFTYKVTDEIQESNVASIQIRIMPTGQTMPLSEVTGAGTPASTGGIMQLKCADGTLPDTRGVCVDGSQPQSVDTTTSGQQQLPPSSEQTGTSITPEVDLAGPSEADPGQEVTLIGKLNGLEESQLVESKFSQVSGPYIYYKECTSNDPQCTYPSITFNMPVCPSDQDTFTFKLMRTDSAGITYNGSHTVKLDCSNNDNSENSTGEGGGGDQGDNDNDDSAPVVSSDENSMISNSFSNETIA